MPLQGLKDFSADARKLGISRRNRRLRRLKRVSSQAFDRLQIVKYTSTLSDVARRGLAAACIPCASPLVHDGAVALVLWLMFEEKVDFDRFESAAAPRVKDWWSELVLAAHALPTMEVWTLVDACAGTSTQELLSPTSLHPFIQHAKQLAVCAAPVSSCMS